MEATKTGCFLIVVVVSYLKQISY